MKDDDGMNIVIFGYGYEGIKLYRKLVNDNKYKVIGFADNSRFKQGNFVDGYPILSMDELAGLKVTVHFSVIIAASKWFEIGRQLEEQNIPVRGIWQNGKIDGYERMSFERLDLSKEITLYAGDICDEVHLSNPNLYGVSISKADARHILHDITKEYPLPDNSIFSYQAEDVLEHIEITKITDTINEIYRILKEGGLFRICLPDYFSPYLNGISMKDKEGNILFDPTGGGTYGENGVSNGGHIWFPDYKKVKELLEKTKFSNVDFLCYHTESGQLIRKEIDFSKGYIGRVPRQKSQNKAVYSIVVDCYK